MSLCMLQGMTELDAAGMATIKSLKQLRVLALSDLQLEPGDADAVRAALPRLTDFSYEQVSVDMHLDVRYVHALSRRTAHMCCAIALHTLDVASVPKLRIVPQRRPDNLTASHQPIHDCACCNPR